MLYLIFNKIIYIVFTKIFFADENSFEILKALQDSLNRNRKKSLSSATCVNSPPKAVTCRKETLRSRTNKDCGLSAEEKGKPKASHHFYLIFDKNCFIVLKIVYYTQEKLAPPKLTRTNKRKPSQKSKKDAGSSGKSLIKVYRFLITKDSLFHTIE